MNRIIKTAKGGEFNVDFDEKGIQEHFVYESSYADFVLNQIYSRIYSRSLRGDTSLL